MNWLTSFIRRAGAAPAASGPDREQLDAWLRQAYDHAARGERAEAERLYRAVLEHDPRDPDALYFLGMLASADGRDMEAAEWLRQALEARPEDPAFWFALGVTYHHLRRLAESVQAYREGLRLQPENDTMRANLAATLIELGRGEEALAESERLLAQGYESAQLWHNLINGYREQGRIEEAIAAGRRALELSPDSAPTHTNYLLTLNYSDRWDAAAIYAEHRRYGARFARPWVEPRPDPRWPRRLRVGYVSPDFRSHVVACFIEPILARHDRSRVEVFCYYNHRWEDAVTERLRGLAEHWVECVHLSDEELAERVRADRIDILVDLAGHTGDNRLPVFAAKPAPVQVSYLGYPNTTGLAAMDYRLTDLHADPPGQAERLSTERLLRPWPTYFCYRPPNVCPDPGPLPSRATGHITFGCFNNLPKMSPSFLDAAARVLAAVAGSRLVLKSGALRVPHVADRFREHFARAGIDSSRVDLRGWEPTVQSHLAAYRDIDIALDSFPYNGATTTCEALWMGVPVVTLAGDRHAGRMGASLLNAVGLGELVARSVDEYVAVSAALAADRSRLEALRHELRGRMRASPLMDEEGFTRALERCYVEIWQAKLAPAPQAPDLDERAIAALLERARALRAEGKRLEAEEACKRVLAARADHADALELLWNLSWETGNHGVAVEWLARGIAANDGHARLHYMMGCSLLERGNPGQAVESFRRALALEPAMAKAHNNLGCALEALGQVAEAAQCYRRAHELDPQLADALYNLGNAERQLGRLGEATRLIERSLALDGTRADRHCNLGDLHYYGLRLEQAIQSYERAIALDPREARAYAGRALALEELGRLEEAEADTARVLELEPRSPGVHSRRLLALHYRRGEEGEALLAEHRAWAERHARRIGRQAARAAHERSPRRRINIGYVSGEFRRHSVASFIEPVLAAHDRSRFKVFCYSNAEFGDEVTVRLRGLAEEWRDIARWNDDWVAERIRADRIDILVDLSGHTGGGRPMLFARKPAPVQVTWLGYPNTTGLEAMDWRLTDALADPPGRTERFHVEKLLRLPRGFLCYRPPEEAPEVGELPLLRTGRLTFGCFNHLPKLTDPMLALWARLLAALPQARLMLKSFGLSAESARRDVLARLARQGIGAERVELRAPQQTLAAHLACYGEVDVALDVFPYNGATTTCEALWMGVPVVSLAGATHVARVGASILTHAGLPELVAESPEQYVEIALSLARDRERLAALRAGLRERLRASALLDARGFARQLEDAYRSMWEQWQRGADTQAAPLRLHVGGTSALPGWKILNIQPGPDVDYVGDCRDLGQFADESVAEIYASHVVEHVPMAELPRTLAGFRRVLKPGGRAMISVPDLEVLSRLFLDNRGRTDERIMVMRMMFGGQTDPNDFHFVGFSYDILERLLRDAGFSRIERVGDFGLFSDTSTLRFQGVPISLNVVAWK
jgi:predicted O-linked N-acetylglucosamine transferase (SPINDLY family)/predicted SAM-dependent methyltransferase